MNDSDIEPPAFDTTEWRTAAGVILLVVCFTVSRCPGSFFSDSVKEKKRLCKPLKDDCQISPISLYLALGSAIYLIRFWASRNPYALLAATRSLADSTVVLVFLLWTGPVTLL